METENALAEQKPKRKAVSARMRFEVFKRDGFRCVYCGATPMQKMLRVDHVVPVAAGGKSTSDNLVTSCHDCNAGKGAVPLDASRLQGQANQGAADRRERMRQIKDYLDFQSALDSARAVEIGRIKDAWQQAGLGAMPARFELQLPRLLSEWPLSRLMEAVGIVCGKAEDGMVNDPIPYFFGILRAWRREVGAAPMRGTA